MAQALSLGGYRECLQTAIRVEDDQDWSPHVIDYGRFKQRLKYFARRRSQIRNMIASAKDHKLSEETLRDLCGPKQRLRAAKKLNPLSNPLGTRGHQHDDDADLKAYYQQMPLSENLSIDQHAHIGLPNIVTVPSPSLSHDADDVGMTDYVELGSADDSGDHGHLSLEDCQSQSTGESSVLSAHTKRRNQRYIMRRLSISERNEIIIFLEWEVNLSVAVYIILTLNPVPSTHLLKT